MPQSKPEPGLVERLVESSFAKSLNLLLLPICGALLLLMVAHIDKRDDDLLQGQEKLSTRIVDLKTTTIDMREKIAGKFGSYDAHNDMVDYRLGKLEDADPKPRKHGMNDFTLPNGIVLPISAEP